VKLDALQYVIIGAYLVFIFIKGVLRSREIDDSDDFLLAGRRVPWFMLLATMGATVVGGGASIGAVGKTYEWGVLMLVVSTGWYLHFIISGLFVAPRFREARLYTVAGYFGHRFGEGPRFVAFVMSLVFSVGVLGAQMVAFGKIVDSVVPDVPYVWAVVAGGLFVTVYSTAGGLPAVVHTDLYQFVILMVGFLLTLGFCVPDLVTSWSTISTEVPAHFFHPAGDKGVAFMLTTFLAFFLGETFSPAYATRYCAGTDPASTRRGIVGAGLFLAVTYPAILFFIALYGRLHFPEVDPEKALPLTLLALNNRVVGALLVAALLSAVMSSADSVLNSTTTIFVKDLYEHMFKRGEGGSASSLRVARGWSAVLGVLGIVLALVLPDVIDLLLFTYNLWAPAIIVPVLVGVLSRRRSRRMNRIVLVTMVLSVALTVGYMFTDLDETVQPSVFGVAVASVVLLAGLLVTRSRRDASSSRP
jgi:SSS family solute:Na+ symporter